MSAVLEPVRTRSYSSVPRRIVCEETTPLNLCERPIIPPITPSPASTRQLAELALCDSLAELFSSRLRAPTHCPSAVSRDIDERELVALDSASAQAHSDTNSPSPTGTSVLVELPSSAERPPELEGNTRITVTASGNGDISQSVGGTSQRSADNNGGELVDTITSAPNKAYATGSKASRTILDSVNHQGTPGSSSIQPLSEVVVAVDIASPTIYCRDKKLYVGKMRDLPCPPYIEAKWTGEIRPRLIKDLLPVLQILPRSMSSEETIIEPELCMAGYVTGRATAVQLKPTVWIRCGGKKCRKVIRKAVDDLDYLRSFSQGPVEVRIRGPRPAASLVEFSSSAEEQKCLVSGNRILQVQHSASDASACGLRLRVLTETDGADCENILTIGGLVKVDGKIYGLTTAHGILDPPRVAKNTISLVFDSSDSASSATSDSESESGDNSDTSSDTRCLDEHGPPEKRRLGEFDYLGQTATAKFRGQIQQLQWKDATFCGPMSFCGRGSATGGTNDVISSLCDTDFALIDMGFSSTYQLYNWYTHPSNWNWSEVSIRGIKHDEDLNAGEVFLLTGQNQVTVGHLLEGSALFMNRTVVFNTRKIELDAPLPTGMSGTWVIQGNLLCGVIVAVYDGDPYAHMITADKMFQDIRDFQPSLFGSREVVIATEDDITKAYGKRMNAGASAPNSSGSTHESTPSTPISHATSQNVMPTRSIPLSSTTHEEEPFGRSPSRSASPSYLPNNNGAAIPPNRWQPRKDATFSWLNGSAQAPTSRHSRQKSLSEALRIIRTRRASVSANAHEIADALKAPLSPRLIILCGVWYMTSILSNTSSKVVLTALPKPVTLTIIQFAFVSSWCVFLAALARRYPRLKTAIPALRYGIRKPSKELIMTTLPLTLFQIGGHILSSDAMSRIPVSLVHTIKGLSPLLTILAYRIFFQIHFSVSTYLSLIPLTLGVIMACSANFSANFMGLVTAFGSAILFVMQNIVSKKIFNEAAQAEAEGTPPTKFTKPDKLNLLCYSSGLAFIFTFPIWLWSEGFPLLADFLQDASVSLSNRPGSLDHGRLALEIIFNGTFHFGQNIVAFVLLSMVSPVTYSVASLTRRVFVICFAIVWFGNKMTRVQGFGIALTSLGLYLYNRTSDAAKADRKARLMQMKNQDPILPLSTDKSTNVPRCLLRLH